jgi:hypothetical protein
LRKSRAIVLALQGERHGVDDPLLASSRLSAPPTIPKLGTRKLQLRL